MKEKQSFWAVYGIVCLISCLMSAVMLLLKISGILHVSMLVVFLPIWGPMAIAAPSMIFLVIVIITQKCAERRRRRYITREIWDDNEFE